MIYRFMAITISCLICVSCTTLPMVYNLDKAPDITLSGFLTQETHCGPPNYGQTPAIDKVLKIYVLVLDRPLEVRGDLARAIGSDEVGTLSTIQVRRMQLAGKAVSGIATNRVGQKVVVSGVVFPKHTGYHHSDMLLEVSAFGTNP